MGILKTFSIVGLTTLGISLSACQKQEAESNSTDPQVKAEVKHITIGFQKSALNLLVARQQKLLEQQFPGAQIDWKEFPAGPQMLEALAVGAVDYGYVGNTPPIFAQAANSNLVYVANQPEAPKAEALIVQKDSKIQSVQDLKGKRIALNKGSNVHYLLLKVLEANNLKLSDIEVVYLPPSDARAAFERGAVDAWVIWDPFFAAAEHQIGARVIASGENVVSNHQFYLADRKFAESHPQVVQAVVNELNLTTDWVAKNQDAAAQLLQKPTGLAVDVLKTSISRMGFGVKPLSTDVIQKQQQVADAFYAQQLIPQKLNIDAAIIK